MRSGVDPHENLKATIERAVAQETDPLTLLETEDALSAIPNSEFMLSAGLKCGAPSAGDLN
jgi:hypothetical protein